MKKLSHFTLAFSLVSCMLLFPLQYIQAQDNSVAIGSNTVKSNAVLWLNGNGSQGLLLPSVGNTSNVSGPDAGMVVYQSSDNRVYYFDGSTWVGVGGNTGGGGDTYALRLQGTNLELLANGAVQDQVALTSFTVGGDITGNIQNASVVSLNGIALPNGTPNTNQILVYNGTSWSYQDIPTGTFTGVVTDATLTGDGTAGAPLSVASLDDADADPANEIQNLSLSGTVINIDGGVGVDLAPIIPPGGTDDQNLVLTGDLLSIEGGTGSVDLSTYIDDADADPTNENQDLSLSGTTLSISNGAGVDLAPIIPPGGTDDQTAAEVSYDNSTSGLGATDVKGALDELALAGGGSGDITDVIAGTGLSGGGTTGSVTLNLSDVGTPGTYTKVTTDAQGRVTTGASLVAADIPNLTLAKVTDAGSLAGLNAVDGATITDLAITDADISNTAGINIQKLDFSGTSEGQTLQIVGGVPTWSAAGGSNDAQSLQGTPIANPLSPTSGQVLKWDGAQWVAGLDDTGAGGAPTLNPGEIIVGDGASNAAAGVTGDLTMNNGDFQIATDAVTTTEIGTAGITDANKVLITDPSGNPQWQLKTTFTSTLDGSVTNELNTDFRVNAGNLEIEDAGGILAVPLTSIDTDNQTATEVTYDNTTSGLTSTDVKSAIDELAAGGTSNQDLDFTAGVITLSDDPTPTSIDLSAYDSDATDDVLLTTPATNAISGNFATGFSIGVDAVASGNIADNEIQPSDINSPGNDFVLTTDAGGVVVWEPKTIFSGGVTDLSGLSDVAVTTPADAQILLYDGTTDNQFENVGISGDITISSAGVATIAGTAGDNVISAINGATAQTIEVPNLQPGADKGILVTDGTTVNWLTEANPNRLFGTDLSNNLVARSVVLSTAAAVDNSGVRVAGTASDANLVSEAAVREAIDAAAGGSLQSAYDGGSEIVLDGANDFEVKFSDASDFLTLDQTTARLVLAGNIDIPLTGEVLAQGVRILSSANLVTSVGRGAGTNGTDNVFVGTLSGQGSIVDGGNIRNTFVGHSSGNSFMTGDRNTFIGTHAGSSSNNVGSNTFVGSDAGFNNTTGGLNTFIGVSTGSTNLTGSSNILIGAGADVSSDGLINAIAIGNGASAFTDNSITLGANNNVIFSGALMPGNVAGAAGEFLQSNGPGAVPTWVAAPGGGSLQSAYDGGGNISMAAAQNIAVETTSGLPILTIDEANERIGIGTGAPSSQFHVSGGNMQIDIEQSLLAVDVADAFTYQTKSVPHYSIGWYDDTETPGLAQGWFSAYPGFKFFTNGVPSLTIQQFGNVGIGVETPQSKLTVNGNAYIAGNLDTGFGITFPAAIDLAVDDNDTGLDVTADGIMDIVASGQRMIAVTPGAVGIATTGIPQASLDIIGNIKITDGTEAAGRVLTSDVNGFASWQPSPSSPWTFSSPDVYFTGGHVGIGITAPTSDFEVEIPAAEEPANTGTVATGNLRLTAGGSPLALDMGIADDAYTAAWIQAHASNNQSSNNDLLLNPNGGNVGIGNTNPAELLVVGDDLGNFYTTYNAAVIGNASTGGALVLGNSTDVMRIDHGTSGSRIIAPGNLFLDVANVGIGTNTMIGSGSFNISSNTTSFNGMYVNTGVGGEPFYGYAVNGSAEAYHYVDGDDGNKWKLNMGSVDRLAFTSTGELGIGITSPSYRVHSIRSGAASAIYGSSTTGTGGFYGAMAHTANGSNHGVYAHSDAIANTIPLGVNRGLDGALVNFYSGGTFAGQISVSGGTVNYGAFTGIHYAHIQQRTEKGYLMTLNSNNNYLNDNRSSEIIYGVSVSSKANDRKIMGSYLGLINPQEPYSNTNPHQVMAVGNGQMWVVDNDEDLEPGDYLISSSVPGHAMLDKGDFDVANIVAKVSEPVNWTEVSQTINGKKHKLITVFYESFTVNHKAERLALEVENLKKTLAQIQSEGKKSNDELEELKQQVELLTQLFAVEATNK